MKVKYKQILLFASIFLAIGGVSAQGIADIFQKGFCLGMPNFPVFGCLGIYVTIGTLVAIVLVILVKTLIFGTIGSGKSLKGFLSAFLKKAMLVLVFIVAGVLVSNFGGFLSVLHINNVALGTILVYSGALGGSIAGFVVLFLLQMLSGYLPFLSFVVAAIPVAILTTWLFIAILEEVLSLFLGKLLMFFLMIVLYVVMLAPVWLVFSSAIGNLFMTGASFSASGAASAIIAKLTGGITIGTPSGI